MSRRAIIGNLDGELALARVAHRGAGPARLKSAVLRRIAAAATLLAPLARAGDWLWLPAEVDPGRLRFDLRGIALTTEPLNPFSPWPPRSLLPWIHTPATAALQPSLAASRSGAPGLRAVETRDLESIDLGRLWREPPSIAATVRANDRRTSQQIASDRGAALSPAALHSDRQSIETWCQQHRRKGPWIARAPLSAAGRERVRLPTTAWTEAEDAAILRRRLERLLQRHGCLLVEPWLDRQDDWGILGLIEDDRALLLAPHRQLNGSHGVCTGIVLRPRRPLPGCDRVSLIRCAEDVATSLHGLGYRGPFSIDAFSYRDESGALRFHPMCEINARLSFAWIAVAWAQRLAVGMGVEMTLRFATSDPCSTPDLEIIPLYDATPCDPSRAWIEIDVLRTVGCGEG